MSRIPEIGRRILEIILPANRRDILVGDFEEYLEEVQRRKGRKVALLYFWWQLISSLPAIFYQRLMHSWRFFRQSFQWALQVQSRQFRKSLLNLLGLVMGISCFIILMLYVQQESTYDQWHAKSERIYRILDIRKVNGVGEESTSAPTPLALNLLSDFPEEIDEAVRFFNFQAPTLALSYVSDGGKPKQFNEPHVYFADASFFRTFDFDLVGGNKGSALNGPNKIVLVQEMAEKLSLIHI